jgi:hypothetical protein
MMVWRPLPAAISLALLLPACFNPSGQSDETGAADPATTGPTGPTEPTTTSSTTTAPTTSSSLTTPTTTSPTTTGDGACDGDADCAAPTAYCLASGECGDCNAVLAAGDSCAAHDPERPTCDQNSGECVECFTAADCPDQTCDQTTHTCVSCLDSTTCTAPTAPVCDLATHECRGCRFHDECKDTACDIATGACFIKEDTDERYAVAGMPVCMDATECTAPDTCCSPAQALQLSLQSVKFNHIIHLAPGKYTDPLAILAIDGRIALLGEGDVEFIPAVMTDAPAIVFGNQQDDANNSAAAVYLSNITVSSKMTTHGVVCWHSTVGLWLDDSAVLGHVTGPAVYSNHCDLTVRRTALRGNQSAARVDALSTIRLENTTVAGSVGGPALYAESAGTLDILYSTIIDDQAGPDNLLSCADGSTVEIRNSAILNPSPAQLGNSCVDALTARYTAFTDPILGASDTNKPVKMSLMATLPGWMAGDLDVASTGGELAGVALWEVDHPTTDLHGAVRGGEVGPDVAGADLP